MIPTLGLFLYSFPIAPSICCEKDGGAMVIFYNDANDQVKLGPHRGRQAETFAFPWRDFYIKGDENGNI